MIFWETYKNILDCLACSFSYQWMMASSFHFTGMLRYGPVYHPVLSHIQLRKSLKSRLTHVLCLWNIKLRFVFFFGRTCFVFEISSFEYNQLCQRRMAKVNPFINQRIWDANVAKNDPRLFLREVRWAMMSKGWLEGFARPCKFAIIWHVWWITWDNRFWLFRNETISGGIVSFVYLT